MTEPVKDKPLNRLLKIKDVGEVLGLSRASIFRLVRAGELPSPRRVGIRAVRWDADEIREFINSRERATGENGEAAAQKGS